MIEFLKAMFTTWDLRPVVLIVPALFGIVYLRGWLHVNRMTSVRHARLQQGHITVDGRVLQSTQRRLASPWRLVSYFTGLAFLVLALASGFDVYGSLLFFVHMIQHQFLIMVAPPLLWLGNPYPFLMWGLPRRLRLPAGRLMTGSSPFRRTLSQIITPATVWIFLAATVWVWHDGRLYSLTLQNRIVHDLEHFTFFLAGMLFAWQVTGATPWLRHPMSYLLRAGYVLSAAVPNMILGLGITFASEPLFAYYTTVPRIWGISVMTDQIYGGVIMLEEATMMYMVQALVLVGLHFQAEEAKAPLPPALWATDEAFRAPGFETPAVPSKPQSMNKA